MRSNHSQYCLLQLEVALQSLHFENVEIIHILKNKFCKKPGMPCFLPSYSANVEASSGRIESYISIHVIPILPKLILRRKVKVPQLLIQSSSEKRGECSLCRASLCRSYYIGQHMTLLNLLIPAL